MTRVQRLTEVFVEVANSLTDDFGVIEFLQQLCERCVELLDVAAAGFVVANAIPMRLRGRVIDTLGLFQTTPGPLGEFDTALIPRPAPSTDPDPNRVSG
ncbi:hypothetical protein ACFZB9_07240 [Kitasatospora sp. NPDC008050]|uniref:hypothetical protein n=1 Tax=Kitasatospora sp. NPDC008050 TaxID=3364021 RepID=UPI0036EF1D40